MIAFLLYFLFETITGQLLHHLSINSKIFKEMIPIIYTTWLLILYAYLSNSFTTWIVFMNGRRKIWQQIRSYEEFSPMANIKKT